MKSYVLSNFDTSYCCTLTDEELKIVLEALVCRLWTSPYGEETENVLTKLKKLIEQVEGSAGKEPEVEQNIVGTDPYIYEDRTIVEIKDSAEGKVIRYLEYGYYAQDDAEVKPYRWVSYSDFEALVKDVLEFEKSGKGYETSFGNEVKQYVEDITEDQMIDCYETADGGALPKELVWTELSEDTKPGIYILVPPESEK